MPRNPLTSVPASRSSKPILKVKLMLVLGFLAVSTLSGLFSTFAWMSAKNAPAKPVDPTVHRDAQAIAEIAARDFLDGKSSPVPTAQGVVADFTPQAAPGSPPPKPLGFDDLVLHHSRQVPLGAKADRLVELDSFYATIGGHLYDVTVPVALPSDYNTAAAKAAVNPTTPVLAASPTIVPATVHTDPKAGAVTYLDYPNALKPENVDQRVRSRAVTWAQTFATACNDDKQALLNLTGDGDTAGYHYQGLCGYSVSPSDVTVLEAVPVTTPKKGLIVRVSLVLHAPGSNGPTLSTQYDLYVGFTGNETLPPVYAWGPAGSFSELDLHLNATKQ